MDLYILFGQRKEPYEGAYAPEALDIMDEYGWSENAEYLEGKLAEYEKTGEFAGLKIIRVDLGAGSQENIREQLIGQPVLKGTVEGGV